MAPLRSVVDSKYGKATIEAVRSSPAVARIVVPVLAAAEYGKHQLPNSMETALNEKLAAAYSCVDTEESLNKTIDVIDSAIDENFTKAKATIDSTIGSAQLQLDETRTNVTNKMNEAKNKAKLQFDKVLLQLTVHTEKAKAKIDSTIGNAKTQINETRSAVTSKLNETMVGAKQQFEQAKTKIDGTIGDAKTQITDASSSTTKKIKDQFAKVLAQLTAQTAAIRSMMQDTFTYFVEKYDPMFTSFAVSVIDKFGPVFAPIIAPIATPIAPYALSATNKVAAACGAEVMFEKQLCDAQKHPVWLKVLQCSESTAAKAE